LSPSLEFDPKSEGDVVAGEFDRGEEREDDNGEQVDGHHGLAMACPLQTILVASVTAWPGLAMK
jgi:hypothetical protein